MDEKEGRKEGRARKVEMQINGSSIAAKDGSESVVGDCLIGTRRISLGVQGGEGERSGDGRVSKLAACG